MPSSRNAILLGDAALRAAAYLDALADRPVAPSPDAVAALAALDVPLPDVPADPATVLDEIDRLISPATMATAGPRFFGFVVEGALPATLAANVLASAEGLADAGYRILNDVVLNQVLVSFGDDARTRRVIAALQADGTCWCGGTCGRARPRCASASRAGRRRTPTWSGRSPRCCGPRVGEERRA